MQLKKIIIISAISCASVGSGLALTFAVDWKKDPEVSNPTANTITYNGNEQELITAGSANGGVLEYVIGDINECTGEYSTNIPTGKDAGVYYVWYRVVGEEKKFHDVSPQYIAVTINKAQANITVDTTPIVVTYGESITIPTATTNFGSVTCDKQASDLVNAGTYTITYTVSDTDNYKGDTKSVSVTINKKELTAPTLSGTYTYNGNEQTVTINNFDSSKMEYASDSTSSATNAGSYTVKVNLKDSSNYKWASAFNGELGWNISKAKVDEPTITTSSFTYDGNEKEVEVSGVESYMTKANDSETKATNAGEHVITYTLDNNHEWNDGNDGILNWSITKGQASITVDTTPIVVTYGESITIPTATTNFGSVSCDKKLSDLVNVGTYTITYTVSDTDNYKGDTKSVSATINKATPIYTAPTAATNLVYNGEYQSSVASVGTVNDPNAYHWEFKLDVFDNAYYTDIRYLINAGDYVIYYKLVITDSNYSDPNIEGSFNVSVAKVTPTITTAPVDCNNSQTGTHVNLCTAATANFGTVWYRIKDYDGHSWTTPPQSLYAGTYYVYYWVKGDDNINDLPETCLECHITN